MLDDQLLAIASTSVLASEHFPCPTDKWEALPRASKMWTAWKAHYRAAHSAHKRQMLAAGKTSHGTTHAALTTEPNHPPDTYTRLDGYLDNLATAATTEHTTLTPLIENNLSLTASITALTASITALTLAYTLLAAGKEAPAVLPRAKKTKSTPHFLDSTGYCWTHGYKVNKGHNSKTCTGRAEGHKEDATWANTMNGSLANKGWELA